VTPNPIPPVVLRGGVAVEDPLPIVLGFLEAWRIDIGGRSAPGSFGEIDLRLANRDGARISASEIAVVLTRRRRIERALGAIAVETSLTGPDDTLPWRALRQLFDAFAGIRGIGLSKATKTLHRKRPALIPMLDSVVQKYLADDDPGTQAPFGERALALVRGYKSDLDRNRVALSSLRREIGRSRELSEVRILDLLIWADQVSPP
jgi:Family of unknown function (DUF6308)